MVPGGISYCITKWNKQALNFQAKYICGYKSKYEKKNIYIFLLYLWQKYVFVYRLFYSNTIVYFFPFYFTQSDIQLLDENQGCDCLWQLSVCIQSLDQRVRVSTKQNSTVTTYNGLARIL